MPTLQEEINAGIRSGSFASRLQQYCLQWREHLSDYALANVVEHLANASRAKDLFATLLDPNFRQKRQTGFGVNTLRSDLQRGLDYFSSTEVDLLRYIKILFLQQATTSKDAKILRIHQGHCEAFAEFLQLDTPMRLRAKIGVHRVLHMLFPMKLRPGRTTEDRGPVTTVELTDYELGSWRCRCGARRGHSARYDYSCQCGASRGNGLLGQENGHVCTSCGQSQNYTLCPSCGTRVRLEIFWQLDEGNVHPSAVRIPLILNLSVRRPTAVERDLRVALMDIPLLLGVNERDDRIVFELPDALWLSGRLDEKEEAANPMVVLRDSLRYNEKRSLREVLESVLKQTLHYLHESLGFRLSQLLKTGSGISADVRENYGQPFVKRLSNSAIGLDSEVDMVRLAGFSHECLVTSSPRVRRKMAYVNLRVICPGGFNVPLISTYVTILRKHSASKVDTLTNSPPNRTEARALDADGIVCPGARVEHGDLLVGIESPRDNKSLDPEARLLRALFGEKAAGEKDVSLVYTGRSVGRVLAVDVVLSKDWSWPSFSKMPGRFVRFDQAGELGGDDLARISVSVLTEQRLEPGDKLYSQDGTEVLVCRVLPSHALAGMFAMSLEPDVVVAPRHPWAPPGSHGQQMRSVRLSFRAGTLVSTDMWSRAKGLYQLVTRQPILVDRNSYKSRIEAKDFDWLLAHGCQWLPLEFYGPRCDVVASRIRLYDTLVEGGRSLRKVFPKPRTRIPALLEQFSSETLRSWALHLKGCCVGTNVMGNEQPMVSFHLMSPDDVLAASRGEVKNFETIRHPSLKPLKGGLFCERIFGPVKDWQCSCGKYNRGEYESGEYRGVVCDRCGVEVTLCSVRRERMGHIELAVPVSHIWFLKAVPNPISLILGMTSGNLERVIYYEDYMLIDPGNTPLEPHQLLTELEFREACETYGADAFVAKMGAQAVREALARVDLAKQIKATQIAIMKTKSAQTRKELADRIKLCQDFLSSNTRPECMILTVLPVIPPELRPLIPYGRVGYASSDLNILYRRVIDRNVRLHRFLASRTPEVIMRSGGRLLQEAVDELLDNLCCYHPFTRSDNRPLVSLTDHLRQAARHRPTLLDGLLTRPLDFSARTRLVAEDTGSIDIALLPDRVAWDLFEPLVVGQLEAAGVVYTVRRAKQLIAARSEEACAALSAASDNMVIVAAVESGPCPLIAFRVRLTRGPALKIHPDLLNVVGWRNLGKPVRIYAVLSAEAKEESLSRLLPSHLCAATSSSEAQRLAEEKRQSPFSVAPKDLVAEIVRRSITRQSFPCGSYDRLLLCYPPRNNKPSSC